MSLQRALAVGRGNYRLRFEVQGSKVKLAAGCGSGQGKLPVTVRGSKGEMTVEGYCRAHNTHKTPEENPVERERPGWLCHQV